MDCSYQHRDVSKFIDRMDRKQTESQGRGRGKGGEEYQLKACYLLGAVSLCICADNRVERSPLECYVGKVSGNAGMEWID